MFVIVVAQGIGLKHRTHLAAGRRANNLAPPHPLLYKLCVRKSKGKIYSVYRYSGNASFLHFLVCSPLKVRVLHTSRGDSQFTCRTKHHLKCTPKQPALIADHTAHFVHRKSSKTRQTVKLFFEFANRKSANVWGIPLSQMRKF